MLGDRSQVARCPGRRPCPLTCSTTVGPAHVLSAWLGVGGKSTRPLPTALSLQGLHPEPAGHPLDPITGPGGGHGCTNTPGRALHRSLAGVPGGLWMPTWRDFPPELFIATPVVPRGLQGSVFPGVWSTVLPGPLPLGRHCPRCPGGGPRAELGGDTPARGPQPSWAPSQALPSLSYPPALTPPPSTPGVPHPLCGLTPQGEWPVGMAGHLWPQAAFPSVCPCDTDKTTGAQGLPEVRTAGVLTWSSAQRPRRPCLSEASSPCEPSASSPPRPAA